MRAILSDISAASHVGEIVGIKFEMLDGRVITGSKATVMIRPGLELNCTLNSTVQATPDTAVSLETIRRLKIDRIGEIV